MIIQPWIVSVQESGDKEFKLERDYEIDGFVIPAGFRCDLASIPRLARFATGLEQRGIHDPASLLHDWLYRNGGTVSRYGKPFNYDREFADKQFRSIMRRVGVKSWHCQAAYAGVYAAGWLHWGK